MNFPDCMRLNLPPNSDREERMKARNESGGDFFYRERRQMEPGNYEPAPVGGYLLYRIWFL